MYDFVTKFEKVCLGLIHPNLRYLKAGLRPVHVSFTLSSVWLKKISKIIFLRKVIRPFRKISKCETGSLHENESTKVPKFCTDISLLSVTVWAKKFWKYCFNVKLHVWFVTKFEKVCLGLIAPKFVVPQGWPSTGTC